MRSSLLRLCRSRFPYQGYGDIAATTHKEERVADIIIIFGVFMLAYIVGTFGMMISNISGDSNRFDGKMRNIQSLMQ